MRIGTWEYSNQDGLPFYFCRGHMIFKLMSTLKKREQKGSCLWPAWVIMAWKLARDCSPPAIWPWEEFL